MARVCVISSAPAPQSSDTHQSDTHLYTMPFGCGSYQQYCCHEDEEVYLYPVSNGEDTGTEPDDFYVRSEAEKNERA